MSERRPFRPPGSGPLTRPAGLSALIVGLDLFCWVIILVFCIFVGAKRFFFTPPGPFDRLVIGFSLVVLIAYNYPSRAASRWHGPLSQRHSRSDFQPHP